MRKLLALFIFAFAALAPAKADYLQVSGIMLTNENSNDVRNDGTIKYDPATNTLTLDRVDIWTKNTSFVSIVQSSEIDGFVPTNPITIVLQHLNKITVDKDAEVDDNFIGIDYNNGVIFTGDGCLEFTSHTTAMKTTSLELNGGCAVILKNGSWFDYGAKEEPTLIAQYLTVDNSALKVLASPEAPRSINSSMVSAQLNGVSSVPHRLIHEKKAYTVTKRNSSMSNSLAGQGALGVSYYLNHSSGGYYSTQTNYKYYDGWYYNDYVVSKDVSFKPLSINVYVNGQGVYKDNDVLPDGTEVAYDPFTKTVTVAGANTLGWHGYLKVVDPVAGTTTEYEGNNSGITSYYNENEIPAFQPQNEVSVGSGRAYLWYQGDGKFYEFENTGSYTSAEIPAIQEGEIYFDKDNSTFTFSNLIVNNSQLTLRDGLFTVNLVGSNYFMSELSEDITLYRSKVTFSGSGEMLANMIYDVSCDAVVLQGGCSVYVNKFSGGGNNVGTLTINNSTLTLLGDENYGVMTGLYDLTLQNAVVENNAAYYKQIVDEYGNGWGFLTDDGVSTYTAMIRIVPDGTITPDPNDPNGGTVTPDPNDPNGGTVTPDPNDPNGGTVTPDPNDPNGGTVTPDPNDPNGGTVTPDPNDPNNPVNNVRYLYVGNAYVTQSNANDLFGDGTARYDAATNTLTLDNLNYSVTSWYFVGMDQEGPSDGIALNESTTPLTIKCLHDVRISVESTVSDISSPTIEYDGELIFTGGGVLNVESGFGTAVKAKTIRINDGTVVNLKNTGSSTNCTLFGEHLYVNSSVLNVVAGEKAYSGINASMETANLDGVWSTHYLSHRTKTRQVQERYKYAFHGGANNTYEYRTRTVTKTTHYDGWYHGDLAYSKDVDIYPETYPIWVNGTNVTRYNFSDITGDGSASYDPLTKTLTVAGAKVVKYEGYLKVYDLSSGTTQVLEPENGNANSNGLIQQATAEPPAYVNQYTIEQKTAKVIFDYFIDGDSYTLEASESGPITFPNLKSGSVTFDKENSVLTFDNAVLEDCQMIIRDGVMNIKLIGNNSFDSELDEDLTFNLAEVTISGEGTLVANQIHDICDLLVIEGGCTVDVARSNGQGVLRINNSTLKLRGHEQGSLTGYNELILNTSKIQTPDDVVFKREVVQNAGKTEYDGFLTDDGATRFSGEVLIAPKSSAIKNLYNDTKFDPAAPKYDLMGRRVDDSYRGIYIQSGVKILK